MSDLEAYRRASPRARLGVGAAILLVLVALAATVGIGIWRSASAPVEQIAGDAAIATAAPSAAPADAVYVHVSGAVRSPGLYVVQAGARVVDAISAAGGLASDAASAGVNLARPVTDGEQLVVPVEGEDPAAGAPGGAATPALVNINTADGAALETLTGIGPALAQRIIDWRQAEGPFGSVDDLLAVSGIGPSVLESVREQATV
ncbi:ComEA family DNA-binding protein [Microbacterium karelineae]|uniref:ComEA family DNA-binding protein n=1 Tax=Microbacterium karelineae TaxID=2654283 RepID=UPI0012E9A64F|nr:ComEA family DNA-binding protein [Microbacterium karelineae]